LFVRIFLLWVRKILRVVSQIGKVVYAWGGLAKAIARYVGTCRL
jgi:hypothetical protein